jgi:hypothetical protein
MMASECIDERYLVDTDYVCFYNDCPCTTDLVPTDAGVLCLEHALLHCGHSDKTVAQRMKEYHDVAVMPGKPSLRDKLAAKARTRAEEQARGTVAAPRDKWAASTERRDSEAAARALQQTAASADDVILLQSVLVACKCMAHNSAMASNITHKLGSVLPSVLRSRPDLAPVFEAYGWTGTQFMGPLDASALSDIISLVSEREELLIPDTVPLAAVSTGKGLSRHTTGSIDPDYDQKWLSHNW